jgi:tRNA modification GTPase
VEKTLSLCLEAGAAPAPPGEFTRRAFLNGKLDLAEAEAVAGIISAQGESALRAAWSAKEGATSREIDRAVEILTGQAAHIAAFCDYPEEDLFLVDEALLSAALGQALEILTGMLGSYGQGRLIREGAAVAIVGRPNVGKSTLMNLLCRDECSIVSKTPGTTRDVVAQTVLLGGLSLRLMDTAGIRKTSDELEAAGVARAIKKLGEADLILAVFDGSAPITGDDRELIARLKGRRSVAVLNKADLPPGLEADEISKTAGEVISLCAKSGKGLNELEKAVERALGLGGFDPGAALLFGERQRGCAQEAANRLEEAREALEQGVTLDAVAVLIDAALDCLLSITGRRVADEVVDEVFSRFCVGK